MSRKLLSDPYLAIHGKIMAKNGHFSWNFDLFLTFFIDCDHIYVPKGNIWGSTSRPHIGDMMMSLFFTLGSTVHDWGWPKNGPFWTKKGQTWQACQHSKAVQKGPKGTKMVNLNVFDHLGPILGPSGPFWTILDKNDFFAPNGQNRVLQRCFRAKYQFLFEMVQKGPDGPKRVPNVQKDLG